MYELQHYNCTSREHRHTEWNRKNGRAKGFRSETDENGCGTSIVFDFEDEDDVAEVCRSLRYYSVTPGMARIRNIPDGISENARINKRFIKSIECGLEGDAMRLDSVGVMGLLEENMFCMRRRIVHDIFDLQRTDCNTVIREICNLLNKRNFVMAFYHGQNGNFKSFSLENNRQSTFHDHARNCVAHASISTFVCRNTDEISGDDGCVRGDGREISGCTGEETLFGGGGRGRCNSTIAITQTPPLKRKLGGELGGELYGCAEYQREHIHVVHDCGWGSQTCRCHRYADGKRIQSVDWSKGGADEFKRYALSLFKYSDQGGRQCFIIQIGPAAATWPSANWYSADTRRACDTNAAFQSGRFFKIQFDESLEGLISKYADRHESKIGYISKIPRINEPSDGRDEKKRSGRKAIPGAIVSFCKLYPTFPTNAIYQTKMWQESDFKFILPSDQVYIRALLNLQTTLAQWNIDAFIDLYLHSTPVWCAVFTDFYDYYYGIEDSFEYMIRLLVFQLNLDFEEADIQRIHIKTYLQELYDVCEKKRAKTNTLFIISEPSAGKNWFIDAVLAFYLNCGNIANYTKSNNFPFQDAVNRRINLWNEPNFMPSATDDIKMLTAGDMMHISKKFEGACPLYRTPLIVLSNKQVFHDPAFRDRIITWRWRAAPFLKDYTKKPHPLAYVKLLHEYDVIKLDNTTYTALMESGEYKSDNEDNE